MYCVCYFWVWICQQFGDEFCGQLVVVGYCDVVWIGNYGFVGGVGEVQGVVFVCFLELLLVQENFVGQVIDVLIIGCFD